MRKLKLFLSMLMLIAFSVGNVWATETTYSLTPDATSTGSSATSYQTSLTFTYEGIGWAMAYINPSTRQTKTNQSSATAEFNFHNTSAFPGRITKVVVTYSALTVATGKASEFKFLGGTSEVTATTGGDAATWNSTNKTMTWTPAANTNYTYFAYYMNGKTATGSNYLAESDAIVVTYETSGGGKTLTSIAVSGAPTKTAYYVGDEFDPAGLVVTGTYSDDSQAAITSGITWAYDPSQELALNQTSIGVTATVNEISSPKFNVTGLSVTAPVVSNWQVTAPADLETGDVVVLTMLKNNVYYAAPNNGTSAPAATVVAVANSKLSNSPAETLQWTVTVVEEGVYQFSKGTNYLKCTDTNNGVRVGAVGTDEYNTFDINTTNAKQYLHTTATMTSATNGRFLGIYNTQDWRCYTSVNTNIKDGSLVIFREPASSKENAGLAYAAADAQKLVKVGGSLVAPTLSNENNLTVTYASSDADVVAVDENTGALTIKAVAGKAVITASSEETSIYKAGSASYTIYVAEQAGTAEDPLTEASAKDLIDLGCTMSAHVTGTIQGKTYYSNSGSYNVTLTNGFLFYYFYAAANSTPFESDILTNGDELVGYGQLMKYGNNYEINPSYMVSRVPYSEPLVDISNTPETAYTPAQAIALYDDPASDLTKEVYVKGVVVATPALKYNDGLTGDAAVYNGTYNVYVKAEDDLSENPTKFEFFRMYADDNNTTFEDGDIQVGEVIIAKGILSKYNSTYEFAQGCQMYSKKSKVTMTFDDLEMEVEDVETLAPKTITLATAEAVTYAIKEGSDDCITLANGVVTATAEGTATIVATVATVEAYIGTSVEFTVTVSATTPVIDTRKVAESPEGGFSSISGDLSGNEISFAAYKGGAQNEPNGNNTAHELRLYKYQATTEYGGYVTISAKDGCTIDQVVITVGGNCNVGWCKDSEELPTKESTPIAVSTSSAFDTGTGLNASSVSVVNLDASNQFKIKTITVYYNGDAITLESIAISGTASVKEYTDGDEFNPAGLSVIGHYSDNSEAEITEGITWAFDPATLSTTDESVSVTATVGELTSAAVVVNGLTVSAAVAPTPSTDNVVILATHGTKLYAMSTTNSNNAFAAIVVEEDGSNIVVTSEEAKAAIQWTRSSNGITATFQDANSKYLTATNGSTNLSLGEDECVWKWYAGEGKNCYSIENEDETKLRSFLYYNNNGIFKNYALSNAGGNYSGVTEVRVIDPANIHVVVPATHTLSYNPNGGTLMEGEDAIADAQVAEGAQVTVAANVYEKEGYVFAGWQYGETVYNAGQKFNMPTTDVELVAQWATISTDNVVIIAQSSGQWYAIQAEAGTANHTVKAVPIVYENNTIYLVESKRASITWERKSAGAQASFKNGTNYLTGKTSDSNDLDLGADECWWTFNSTSNIYQTHADHSLLYSESAEVFKNYKSSNAGKTGYSALPIVVPAVFGDPSYEIVRQELIPNAYYTMCLEKAVDAVQGGSIWRVLSKAQNDKDIILEEVTGTLQAGRPYIFYATSDIFKVVYAGSAVLEPVNDEGNNGLVGSFTQEPIAQSPNNFIIYNNALYYVNSDNVYVGANRAYLNMTGVPAYSNEPQQGAPRRRVTMAVYGEQTATGIDALNATDAPVKMMINGQMYILRGEKMYDTTGRLVK